MNKVEFIFWKYVLKVFSWNDWWTKTFFYWKKKKSNTNTTRTLQTCAEFRITYGCLFLFSVCLWKETNTYYQCNRQFSKYCKYLGFIMWHVFNANSEWNFFLMFLRFFFKFGCLRTSLLPIKCELSKRVFYVMMIV